MKAEFAAMMEEVKKQKAEDEERAEMDALNIDVPEDYNDTHDMPEVPDEEEMKVEDDLPSGIKTKEEDTDINRELFHDDPEKDTLSQMDEFHDDDLHIHEDAEDAVTEEDTDTVQDTETAPLNEESVENTADVTETDADMDTETDTENA